MAEPTYRTRHRISGKINENTPQSDLDVFGEYLEVVGPDAKPFLPEMHRATLPPEPTLEEIRLAKEAVRLGLVEKSVLDVKEPTPVKAEPDTSKKDKN